MTYITESCTLQVSSLHKIIFKIRNTPFYCHIGLEFVDSNYKYIATYLIALHYDSAQWKICLMNVVKYSKVPKIFPTKAVESILYNHRFEETFK
jgi:hypothetical protein